MAIKSYSKSDSIQLDRNFKLDEFKCKCRRCKNVIVDEKLVKILQNVRDHFGVSVNINSGYRCKKHNAEVGGSAGSHHMKGMAADIVVKGVAPKKVAQYLESQGVKRIGLYEGAKEGNFVHVGSSDSKRYWLGHAGVVTETFGSSDATVKTSKVIWDFLMEHLKNPYGVAGIIGNLNAESALNPKNLQQTFEKKLGHTDASYTAAVDNGTYTNFVRDGAGYGLAQWTWWSRKQKLLNFCRDKNKSVGDLNAQLQFLVDEMKGSYKTMWNKLSTAKSVKEASDLVLTQYERPADMGESVKKKRAEYGQKYFDMYAEISADPVWVPKVGDIVKFTGDTHYQTANQTAGLKCTKGEAKITMIYQLGKSKHPYHLVKTGAKGPWGWCDEGSFVKK